MVRFVVGPEHVLTPDFAERLPGRGIWLNAEGDMIEAAQAHGELQRVITRRLGTPITIPSDLRERLIEGLGRRIIELLALARRSGQAWAGVASEDEAPRDARSHVVLHADDASGQKGRGAIAAGASERTLGTIFGRRALACVSIRRGRLGTAIEAAALRRARLVTRGGVTETVWRNAMNRSPKRVD